MMKQVLEGILISLVFVSSAHASETKQKSPTNQPRKNFTETIEQVQKWYQTESAKILGSKLSQNEKQNQIRQLAKQFENKVKKITKQIRASVESYARLHGQNLKPKHCGRFKLPEKLVINQNFMVRKDLQCNENQVMAYYLPSNEDTHDFKFMFGISAHKTGQAQQESLLWLKKIRDRLSADPLAHASLLPPNGDSYDLDIFITEPKFMEHNYWSFHQKGEGYIQYQYIRRLYPEQRIAGIDFESAPNPEESSFIKGIPQFRKEADMFLKSDKLPSPKPF